MKNWLLSSPSVDDLIRLLRAWRFWLIGAIVGGLLGTLAYVLVPPPYRARATVVVDFNLEKAWPDNPDREVFYYLEREARKLEEVAWSDATLQQVADQMGGMTVDQLRSDVLELSEPHDGAWHFYATERSPQQAEQLASAWAHAFYQQTLVGVDNAVALDAARKALAANPTDPALMTQVNTLEAGSLGITPEMQISLAQSKHLPAERKVGLGNYVLAGAVLFLLLSALFVLFFEKQQGA